MAGGRAARGHGGEDVRLAKGGKPDLALGLLVGPARAPKHTILDQDERGAECLRVYEILEGDAGQVSAVSDEEGAVLVDEFGLHFGSTVLFFVLQEKNA